jgi:hypothetical protein
VFGRIEAIGKRNLFSVVFREQADLLHGFTVSGQLELHKSRMRAPPHVRTLCNIPARARAVYAPREKPTSNAVCDELPLFVECFKRTEQTNSVTRVVIPHKKLIAIQYVLVKIPSSCLV